MSVRSGWETSTMDLSAREFLAKGLLGGVWFKRLLQLVDFISRQ